MNIELREIVLPTSVDITTGLNGSSLGSEIADETVQLIIRLSQLENTWLWFTAQEFVQFAEYVAGHAIGVADYTWQIHELAEMGYLERQTAEQIGEELPVTRYRVSAKLIQKVWSQVGRLDSVPWDEVLRSLNEKIEAAIIRKLQDRDKRAKSFPGLLPKSWLVGDIVGTNIPELQDRRTSMHVLFDRRKTWRIREIFKQPGSTPLIALEAIDGERVPGRYDSTFFFLVCQGRGHS